MYEGAFFPKYLSGSGYLAKKEDARNGRRLFPFLDSTLQPKLTLLAKTLALPWERHHQDTIPTIPHNLLVSFQVSVASLCIKPQPNSHSTTKVSRLETNIYRKRIQIGTLGLKFNHCCGRCVLTESGVHIYSQHYIYIVIIYVMVTCDDFTPLIGYSRHSSTETRSRHFFEIVTIPVQVSAWKV